MDISKAKDFCIAFNRFMIEKKIIPHELYEAYVESNNLIEKAYTEGKNRVLKAMINDISEQLKYMPLSLALEFKDMVSQTLHFSYENLEIQIDKSVNKILNKGKISTPDEYDSLQKIAEDYLDKNKVNELKRLNNILLDYHKRLK